MNYLFYNDVHHSQNTCRNNTSGYIANIDDPVLLLSYNITPQNTIINLNIHNSMTTLIILQYNYGSPRSNDQYKYRHMRV